MNNDNFSTLKLPRFNLQEISSKLVGSSYQLCGKDGLDCFSLVKKYLEIRGFKLPAMFKGYGLSNYASLFRTDPTRAKGIMLEFMQSISIEMKPHETFAGDILLVKLKRSNESSFLAIDGGNGVCIVAGETDGVCTVPVKYYDVERVFRCQQQFQ